MVINILIFIFFNFNLNSFYITTVIIKFKTSFFIFWLLNENGPIILFPHFIKLFRFEFQLLSIVFFGCPNLKGFDSHCRCDYFITEISVPVFLIFNHVGVAVAETKINIKVFHLLWDLLLKPSFLFCNLNYLLMCRPEPFHIFQRLPKEKGQIIGLLQRNSNAFHIDMRVIFRKLL